MTKSKHTKEFQIFMENIKTDLLYANHFLSSPNAFGPHYTFKGRKHDGTLRLLESSLKYSLRSTTDFSYKRCRWLAEIMITRFIGHFDYYISQVLKSVFQQKPETLIGSKIDMEDILDITSKTDIIHKSELFQFYADKKVHDLGYRGLFKLTGYLKEKIKLNIDNSDENPIFSIAKLFAQVRNIIVHNAGRVDRTYLEDARQTTLQVGDLHPFTEGTYIRDGIIAIFTIAEDIDTQLVDKFNPPDVEEIDVKAFRDFYLSSDDVDQAIEDSQQDLEA